MPNHAPTLLGLSSSVTFAENAVNAAPALIDSDVTFSDLEGNLAGGTILVSGLLAEDRVSVRNQGFGAGQIGLFGVNVTYGGVAIGTFSGGTGTSLTINLNSSATATAVDALLQNLSYGNVSDSPTELRTLNIEVRDADGAPVLRTASYSEIVGAGNPLSGIDIGFYSAPAFGDVDGDGDKDLVVGERTGLFRTFRNDGGSFSELTGTANPFNLVDVGSYSTAVFVDIDGDGDSDLVSGSTTGTFRTFINRGGVFTEATGAGNPLNGLDAGTASTPAFADLDNDGDLDLVSGEFTGSLVAYDNVGGVFTALIGAANPFDGLDFATFSAPSSTDVDGDGDDDLLVSNSIGDISLFRNNGGSFVGFVGETSPFAGIATLGNTANPTFVDIDGDGDNDVVIGQLNGMLRLLRNTAPLGRSIDVHVTAQSDVPTLTDVAPSVAYLENGVNAAPVHLDTDVDFSLGSSPLDGGRLIVSGLLPEDRISIIASGSIAVAGNQVSYNGTNIGTFTGGQGTSFILTFAAGVGETEAEALIESLGYGNASDTPTATRSLHFNVVDSAGGALDGALALTPFPVNPTGLRSRRPLQRGAGVD
jgi:hypothetical protein